MRGVVLTAAMAGLACSASADKVIGNIDNASIVGTNLGVKAAGFRMPAGASFMLDGVTVASAQGIIGSDTFRPVFSVWEGTAAPTTRLVELRVPANVETGWTTLTPARPLDLAAGGTYWIVAEFNVGPGVGGGYFRWDATTGVLPTGPATHVAYLFNGNPSGVSNSYELQGTWSGTCIDFDRTPGADRIIGTADDVAISAPAFFVDQTAQVTTNFQTQGIVFLPNPSVDDRNEILNNDTFPGRAISSEPNLFTTRGSLGAVIDATFLRPVYKVEADIGLGDGTDVLEIFDGAGTLIGSAAARIGRVSLESSKPISRMRVRPQSGLLTTGMDDLCLSFLPPASCAADLTGSSDPNDPAYGVPDGFIDASDFFFYLDRFVEPCP